MKKLHNVVVRYIVTEVNEETKKMKIHKACYTRKEAVKFRKELMGEESKRNVGVDEFIFDESKIGFNNQVINNFYYAFSVDNLDFPFEVGMAVDWVNGNTVDIMVGKQDKISEWM